MSVRCDACFSAAADCSSLTFCRDSSIAADLLSHFQSITSFQNPALCPCGADVPVTQVLARAKSLTVSLCFLRCSLAVSRKRGRRTIAPAHALWLQENRDDVRKLLLETEVLFAGNAHYIHTAAGFHRKCYRREADPGTPSLPGTPLDIILISSLAGVQRAPCKSILPHDDC